MAKRKRSGVGGNESYHDSRAARSLDIAMSDLESATKSKDCKTRSKHAMWAAIHASAARAHAASMEKASGLLKKEPASLVGDANRIMMRAEKIISACAAGKRKR